MTDERLLGVSVSEGSIHEPLAIVGMACRFPGGADDPRAFWRLLRDGVDAVTEVPLSRWNAARYYHPTPGAPGRMVTRWGGFVERADAFDAAFFGIAPREAARMDPQQRWLAEVSWEAIEDAGVPPEMLAGTRTGVFVGICSCDYLNLLRHDHHVVDGYANIGSALSIAANRLSYLFDLHGPSLAVDTACSSSLVALHLAARSLWSGETEFSIVAASNELLSPESSIGFSQARMLSPRGRSRPFDAGADGYVRAEGAAAVLVMPWRTAHAMGLEVRGLVVSTASNQDGRTSSLTVPSQNAQEMMFREALQQAGACPQDVVYAEAHGTGTPVGDPIEARALAAVFGAGRGPDDRLLIGSVKGNIGHLESAAGMAGLIKGVLVLEQQQIPPTLHFTTPTPDVPFASVRVPTAMTPLPAGTRHHALVAVNSFGFGGTNAHALLARAPAANRTVDHQDGPCIFPFSARASGALVEYAQAFARHIAEAASPRFSLRELCAAASLGKSHHPLRAALVADSLASLQAQLTSTGESAPVAASKPPKIAFVFSGHGPQWWGMGRSLYETTSVVRRMWERCDALCQACGGPSVLDALLAGEADSRLHRTDVAQPALFTLQAGLVALWREWGIDADVVIGHSLGEVAAAWAAGAYDLEEIFRILVARSRAQQKTQGRGRMLAAAITEEEADGWERRLGGLVSLAAVNAPRLVTFSGDTAALEEIAAALTGAEVFHRFLTADYAFHSAQMDPIEAELRAAVQGVSGHESAILMISTVTAAPISGAELDPDYWWRNARRPVRFSAAIERALTEGCTAFVEIGPHPVLASSIAESALALKREVLIEGSLRRNDDDRKTMLQALAALYRYGATVRWEGLYQRPARALRLPAYPWQRQRLWHESGDTAGVLRRPPSHPLLGDRQTHPQPTWVNRLDTRLVPWLADHRLAGAPVMPAAAYLEMAAAAVREHLGDEAVYLEDIRFHRLLFLPPEESVTTCVRLDPGAGSFQILVGSPDAKDAWEVHAEGLYRHGRLHTPPEASLPSIRESLDEERDPDALYRDLAGMGQIYGPQFRGLTALRVNGIETALAAVADPAERDWPYVLFPPTLDSCLHPGVALRRKHDTRAVVVSSIRQLRLFRALPRQIVSHLRIVERSESSYLGDVAIYDANGAVLAQIDGLKLTAIESDKASPGARGLYQFAWERLTPAVHDGRRADAALIFADAGGSGASLGESLGAQGIATTLVFAAPKRRRANGPADVTSGHGGSVVEMLVDLSQRDWAVGLWKALEAAGPLPAWIVYLWSTDAAPSAPDESAGDCSRLLTLIQGRLGVGGSEQPARWLVATDRAEAVAPGDTVIPARAPMCGFVRTLQSEYPHWNVSLLDCVAALPVESLLSELAASDVEPEVAVRDGVRWGRRLRRMAPQSGAAAGRPPAYAAHVGQPGRLDSVEWRGRSRPMPGPAEVEVEIAAAGLNFRDVMKALAIYPVKAGDAAGLGDEFSGRVVRVGRGTRRIKTGDRVCALGGGAFASHAVVPEDWVLKIPDTLAFTDAAGIPVVFGTAYHALHTLARLQPGETVLVHAAAGGVGLAAVQLAMQIGATIFATAGSAGKREYLRSLGVTAVMDSRTLDFADEILRRTAGRGVDVVLNSLSGAFQQKSLAVCAPHGRFIEIGKRDLYDNKGLPLTAFQRSLSFFAFDLGAVIAAGGAANRATKKFVSHGITRGTLTPLPCTTFPARQAVDAMRLMRNAQHIGKIALEFESAPPPDIPAEFWPDRDATYLITGGLSGFGLATARWLAERGATHLALLSRSGRPAAPQHASAIDAMRASGVTLTIVAADVADAKALAGALRRVKRSAAPLRGVFHAAMVLRDRPLAEMTADELAAVLAPKVAGAWNLHVQTRGLPLDCFVMFSSLSALIGGPGQGNYAAANAFLDALAHHRRAAGLPGLSVNWGQIADVGVVADRPELARYLDGIGISPMSSRDALASLAKLIPAGDPQVGVMNVQWDRLAAASAKFQTSPVFRDLVQAGTDRGTRDPEARNDWRAEILRLPPAAQGTAVLEVILRQLSATFGMAQEEIDSSRPLAELGLDSLMAVELKARLETRTGCELPLNLFNANLTAGRLASRFVEQLRPAAPAASTAVHDSDAPRRPAPADPDAQFFRHAGAPLEDLIRASALEPLTAAALMPWPAIVLDQMDVRPAAFFDRMSGGRVSLDVMLQTPLGSIGIFMLPLPAARVTPAEGALVPLVLEGIARASACGAQCVALTGLIPSATGYGAAIEEAAAGRRDFAPVTTGHATTIAAVILNLAGLLREAGRELTDETVLCYGLGSIGLGALQLMLDVLPHPAELRLCDPYRSAQFFTDLEETLRKEHAYRGIVRIAGDGVGLSDTFRDVTVIVGATNVADAIDVTRLASDTLIVDDSWPHCMNGQAAFARLARDQDILYTEGGFVRGAAPIPRLAHLPGVPSHLQRRFAGLNPYDITACILSAALSVRQPALAPTIGLIAPAAARQHWTALNDLGFRASTLNYEGEPMGADHIAAFRERRRRSVPPARRTGFATVV